MSLAVLKRKTKETNKTKQGTFSLNGTKRNLSYVGKNYAGMTRNPYCYTNSKNIKKSVGSQNSVIKNRTEPQAKNIDVEEELAETIHLWVTPKGADEDDPTNIECLTPITKVNIVNSNGVNKYVFNNGTTYDSDISYGLYNGTYIFTGIPSVPVSHAMAIIIPEEKKHLISYTGVSYYDELGVEKNADQGSEGNDNETYYYGSIRVEVMGDFGTVSVKCLSHGEEMGGLNLLTYTDSCVSENHYKFYTDENGLNELTPKFTLYLNNTYIFHRLSDSSQNEHPFYISDVEPARDEETYDISTFFSSTDIIDISSTASVNAGIIAENTLTLTFSDSMTKDTPLYYFCTNILHNMVSQFILENGCNNLPRPGTMQKICNNWVQRIEPHGNVSQGDYIKNKRILATTKNDTSEKQSDNQNMCAYTRIGGKLHPNARYVDNTTTTMTSSDYNSVAIQNRATICSPWQKPFPFIVNAADTANCSTTYSQANEAFKSYYKNGCDGTEECG